MKPKKAVISVESTSFGYSVCVRLSNQAALYPSVMISYHNETQETGYIVELNPDDIITTKSYARAIEQVEDTPAGDFLEVAELIHRQKQVRLAGESWKNVVDDILSI